MEQTNRTRVKFATQVRADLLAQLREMADAEGRQLQAMVDEAFADLIEKRKNATPRSHVMGNYLGSHAKFAPLYRKLAE